MDCLTSSSILLWNSCSRCLTSGLSISGRICCQTWGSTTSNSGSRISRGSRKSPGIWSRSRRNQGPKSGYGFWSKNKGRIITSLCRFNWVKKPRRRRLRNKNKRIRSSRTTKRIKMTWAKCKLTISCNQTKVLPKRKALWVLIFSRGGRKTRGKVVRTQTNKALGARGTRAGGRARNGRVGRGITLAKM